MTIWLILLAMGLITFALRASFVLPGDRLRLPPLFKRALRYVPVAVLTALIVPMALAPAGALMLDWRNPALAGMLAALLIARYTGRTLLAMLASFALYLLWLRLLA
ncbi:AzlD domain-containing protein [Chitinilyticum piscinae]|uniref:AzlD domain-containing protein n=1 Tax=Chitinilyticum piscinae TaxID=2866724 RepID=A0A8J7FYA6_9NEIS|nr:AzlD domain-containing protein [Chitinilyticum piscinae]MBE9608645.1 AzlD domain-containing protein [Chitinilyticum piscinae]